MTRSRLLVPCITLAALLVGVAWSPTAGAATAGPNRYVALGDSYTSAPFIGPPAGTPLGCARSGNNYPHLVQATVRAAAFVDVSCGGATTDDFSAPQSVPLDGPNPPQFDALTPDTDLVSIGIGGNDIGFSGIVINCISLLPFGSPCRDRYVTGGVDQLAARIQATAPKIARALATVHQRAPQARVLLVGYPAILPDSGNGCWPRVPYTPADVRYLRATAQRLNQMLAAQAAANGASYVDAYTPGIGHDVCRSASVRWVEGIVPTNPAFPVHPNARGEAGMAAAVLATLATGVARP
jgi:lysophospholipase L1-like esterase